MGSRTSTPKSTSPSNLLRTIAYGFQQSRILLTAFELGVFTAIGNTGRSSKEIARRIKADARATDRLLNALCAIGFLTKKKGHYANTPLTARVLIEGRKDYLGGLMHTVHLWETWSTLTQAVINGTSVYHRPSTNNRGDRWLSAFIAAMHDRARLAADVIIGKMDLSGVHRVLDVGGGSGAYAMAFVRRGKDITATIFDLPNVIPLTQKYVRAAGLFHKIGFRKGNYLTNNLGRKYDLIFLSAIIHSNSNKSNKRLIKKCARALNPGGRVVVQDFIMSEDRVHPAHGAIFALNMLVGTDEGDTYTQREVTEWMKSAGLTNISRVDTAFGTSQIIGRKKN